MLLLLMPRESFSFLLPSPSPHPPHYFFLSSCSPFLTSSRRSEVQLTLRFYYFLRPFFSLLAIFISQVSVFYHAHIKDSWPQFIYSAFIALVGGIWNVIMREQGHVRADAGKWRDAKGEELKK